MGESPYPVFEIWRRNTLPELTLNLAGRQLELNRTMIAAIAELLESGLSISDCCKHEGIRVNTFKKWYKVGKSRLHGDKVTDGFDLYVEFYLKVSKARVTGRRNLLETIRIHASKDWKAAAYLLERGEKSRFMEKDSAAPQPVMATAIIEAAKQLVN